MTDYDVEKETKVTILKGNYATLFQLEEGKYVADITQVQWIIDQPVVTVSGWTFSVDGRTPAHEHRWLSTLPIERLPEDLRALLNEAEKS